MSKSLPIQTFISEIKEIHELLLSLSNEITE